MPMRCASAWTNWKPHRLRRRRKTDEGEWTDEQEAEYQALQAQWEAFDDLGDNMEAALRE